MIDLRKVKQEDIDNLMERFHKDMKNSIQSITQNDLNSIKENLLNELYKPYSQLSTIEKMLVANGCGGSGSLINPPKFIFGEDCGEHDWGYAYGGNKIRRKQLDKKFYEGMKKSIVRSEAKGFKRIYYEFWAFVYYLEVRRHGAKFFNFKTGARL